MLKLLLLSSVALVAVLPSAVWAEGADETIVVSATRTPTPQEQVGSSVTVIDAAEIDARQQRSLPDILRDVPGLNVVQSGGEGGQTSLFLRGANANQTKVVVDGIDVADPSNPNGAYDFGKFGSADIAQVEVLRGPGSSLYGSDAIGGVVNIVTKAGEGPLTLDAGAEGGSFDTFNQNATASGATDGFHYRVSLDHIHAGATPVTPLDFLPAGEKRNDDYYDGLTGSTKLGYDVTDNFDLGFVGSVSNSLARVTGDATDPVSFASYPAPSQTRIDTLSYATRGTAHLVWGILDQTLGLAYSSTATSDMDPNNGAIPSSGNRVKLDWQGTVSLGKDETIVLGAETARDAIHLPILAGITTNAGYGELLSRFAVAPDVTFSNSASLRYDSNSRFGAKTTWHIAPVLALAGTDTRLHGSYGTGFKAPSLDQLYESFPAFFFYANPALKPETSTGYDIGVDQNFLAVTGLGVTGGLTWFHNAIKNLIATDPVTFSTDVNIGRARTEGLETYLAWKPLETLSLRADYTNSMAQDAVLHQELVRRPRDKASVNALWQALPELSLDLSALYVGDWIDGSRDFSVSRLKAPGYFTADIAVQYRLTDNLTLTGRISNLADKTYQDPTGFLQPGRAVYAGVKVHL